MHPGENIGAIAAGRLILSTARTANSARLRTAFGFDDTIFEDRHTMNQLSPAASGAKERRRFFGRFLGESETNDDREEAGDSRETHGCD